MIVQQPREARKGKSPSQVPSRGVGVTKPIDRAKELVPVEELAEMLSGAPGVRRGRDLAFVCPLHDDHDPSLRVDPERGVWYCDPCAVGGNVVKLARLAWVYPDTARGASEAAAFLLMKFGHDVPQRPPVWFARQKRQAPVRDALEEIKVRHIQRRLFRVFLPAIKAIEDDEERREEIERVWDDCRLPARLILARRRS